jgi:hypothetical protein
VPCFNYWCAVPPRLVAFEKKIPVRATVMGVVEVECSGL